MLHFPVSSVSPSLLDSSFPCCCFLALSLLYCFRPSFVSFFSPLPFLCDTILLSSPLIPLPSSLLPVSLNFPSRLSPSTLPSSFLVHLKSNSINTMPLWCILFFFYTPGAVIPSHPFISLALSSLVSFESLRLTLSLTFPFLRLSLSVAPEGSYFSSSSLVFSTRVLCITRVFRLI